MNKKFKVLICGLGNIGMGYDFELNNTAHTFTHAKSFYNHKNFRIIGGVDIDEKNVLNLKKSIR